MADKEAQEQSIDRQDPVGNSQESTKIESKASEQAHEKRAGSDKDVAHDIQVALDRVQLLENGHRELTSLFHKYLDDDPEEPLVKTVQLQASNAPACEIERISNTEWRGFQDHPDNERRYSLLTVVPKARGDSGSRNQAVEIQTGPFPGSGKATVEPSSVSALGSKTPSNKPYRAILNGRAELMEVLGGMFNSQSLPGFYFWFWPFKHLIDHGEKLRARLSEEESRFKDADQKADDVEHVTQGDASRQEAEQVSGGSQSQAEDVETLDSEQKNQERMASQEDGQVEQNATDLPHQAIDNEIKAGNSPVDDRRGELKTEDNVQATKPDTEKVEDTRLRDELRCLVTFMDTDLKDLFSVQKDIDNGTRKLISFDHLWQLYKPGQVVISGRGQNRAYVVMHVTGGRTLERTSQVTMAKDELMERYDTRQRIEREAYFAKYPRTSPFVIDCFYIDFDGTKFGALPKKFEFQEYDGEVAITSLEVYPIRLDDDPKRTEKALMKKGRKFVKLAGVEHKYYSGPTLREADLFEAQGEVHGEIIVDFALAIDHLRKTKYDWDVRFGTGVIAGPTQPDQRESKGYYNVFSDMSSQYKPTYFMEDERYENEIRSDFIEKTSLLKERAYHEKLPSEALMLLPPRVYGFSLLDRKWFAFDISLVEDVKLSNQSFDNLVIPEDHKKIVQALVLHHTKRPGTAAADMKKLNQEFSMDIVRGKGRGLIVLLHGVPGVGKTSTAECVAAQTQRPLFPITCGDIGSTAEQVEIRLNGYFDMAHKWGCVLLLDEADVFLARREKGGDLQRNGIVSVFLRVLEYYSGILILTTNRIGEFDEAFSSRVHIKLYYPKLDRKSTLEIWKMNIRRVAESEELGVDVKENEIKKFARRQWADSADNPTQRWNGRQIRNAFQTAIALAKWDHQESEEDVLTRPCLSVKQFEVVAQTSAHFDAYITKMHGIDEGDTWETIAARDFLRKNETPRKPAGRLVPPSLRARAARRSNSKAEPLEEDDEEGDETDSDEDEEKMKELEAKLKKMQQKKQGVSDKKLKNSHKEPPSKRPVDPEVETGTSSDEERD